MTPTFRWKLHRGSQHRTRCTISALILQSDQKSYSGAQPNCQWATQSILHCVKTRYWRGKAGGRRMPDLPRRSLRGQIGVALRYRWPASQGSRWSAGKAGVGQMNRGAPHGGAPLFLLRFQPGNRLRGAFLPEFSCDRIQSLPCRPLRRPSYRSCRHRNRQHCPVEP